MSKKKTTKDKNLDLQIDFAIDDTRCATLRMREVSRAYKRARSTHRARRRALRTYYVNLLLKNWYVQWYVS